MRIIQKPPKERGRGSWRDSHPKPFQISPCITAFRYSQSKFGKRNKWKRVKNEMCVELRPCCLYLSALGQEMSCTRWQIYSLSVVLHWDLLLLFKWKEFDIVLWTTNQRYIHNKKTNTPMAYRHSSRIREKNDGVFIIIIVIIIIITITINYYY